MNTKAKEEKLCLGYGPTEGKCTNKAGCLHSPYWCFECNEVRMETIGKNLETILANFENRKD